MRFALSAMIDRLLWAIAVGVIDAAATATRAVQARTGKPVTTLETRHLGSRPSLAEQTREIGRAHV